ncbi:hypothetical protein A2U01_0092428, partial [Trifolium medium]|nr:hypothetical protein [Trifolium medium]
KGTQDYGLAFPTSNNERIELECFSDSDWCGDKDDEEAHQGTGSGSEIHPYHGLQRSRT